MEGMLFCFRGLNKASMEYLQNWFIDNKINYMVTSYSQDNEQLYNLDFGTTSITITEREEKLFITLKESSRTIVISTFDFITFNILV